MIKPGDHRYNLFRQQEHEEGKVLRFSINSNNVNTGEKITYFDPVVQ